MNSPSPIKIMYLCPRAPKGKADDIFADMARKHKLPNTEVHIATLPVGEGEFTNLEFRSYEAMVTRGIIRAVRAASREGFDALAIGCFYDTALYDAREISGGMIVTAPCIASCGIASNISNRFGIIVGRRKWVNQMQVTTREYGYEHRLSGFYHVDLGANDFQKDHSETQGRLIAAGRKAVTEDYAEALILGCTMEVGFYKDVENQLGVPVIDASIAALKHAEYSAILKRQCGWVPSRKWSGEPPPEEEIARIGGFDVGEAFGKRIVVQ